MLLAVVEEVTVLRVEPRILRFGIEALAHVEGDPVAPFFIDGPAAPDRLLQQAREVSGANCASARVSLVSGSVCISVVPLVESGTTSTLLVAPQAEARR